MNASQAERLRRTWAARAQIWLGLALGLAALHLLFRRVDLAQLGEVFQATRWPLVALTLLASLLSPVLKAARWRWLFYPQAPKLGLLPLASLIVIGQAVNFMIPGRWGELVRMYLTGEEAGIRKSYTLGTIAAEKVLDLAVLAVLVVGLIPFITLPAGLAGRVEIVVLTAVAVLVGMATLLGGQPFWLRLTARVTRILPGRTGVRWQERIAAGLAGLNALANRKAALMIWGWTLAFWLLAALTNLLLLLAFDLPGSPLIALVVLAVLQGGVAVPSTPGKIGVFQLLCLAALAVFGVPEATGLAYGLVLHVLVVGGVSVWAAGALWRRSWSLSRLGEAARRER